MIVVLAVALLCTGALILGLLAVVCRHHEASWFASETCVLCVATPAAMLLGALGVGLLVWLTLHGGIAAALAGDAVIGSPVVVALFVVAWRLLAARIRGRRPNPLAAAPATLDPA